jgi:hypothetical protein
MPIARQTRSQTTIHTQDIPNAPLPPRVITPRTLHQSPPRVPTGSQRLSPCNLSQDDFSGMDSAHLAISLGHNHWSQQHQANAVIHPITGKKMEYSALMKDPTEAIKSNGYEIPLADRQSPPKNNSTFIGAQDVKIFAIITQSIIQRNITKICAT